MRWFLFISTHKTIAEKSSLLEFPKNEKQFSKFLSEENLDNQPNISMSRMYHAWFHTPFGMVLEEFLWTLMDCLELYHCYFKKEPDFFAKRKKNKMFPSTNILNNRHLHSMMNWLCEGNGGNSLLKRFSATELHPIAVIR